MRYSSLGPAVHGPSSDYVGGRGGGRRGAHTGVI